MISPKNTLLYAAVLSLVVVCWYLSNWVESEQAVREDLEMSHPSVKVADEKPVVLTKQVARSTRDSGLKRLINEFLFDEKCDVVLGDFDELVVNEHCARSDITTELLRQLIKHSGVDLQRPLEVQALICQDSTPGNYGSLTKKYVETQPPLGFGHFLLISFVRQWSIEGDCEQSLLGATEGQIRKTDGVSHSNLEDLVGMLLEAGHRELLLDALGNVLEDTHASTQNVPIIISALMHVGPPEETVQDLALICQRLQPLNEFRDDMPVFANHLLVPGNVFQLIMSKGDFSQSLREEYVMALAECPVYREDVGAGVFLALALGGSPPGDLNAISKLSEMATYYDGSVFRNTALVNLGRVASVSEIVEITGVDVLAERPESDVRSLQRMGSLLAAVRNSLRAFGPDCGGADKASEMFRTVLDRWSGLEEIKEFRTQEIAWLRHTPIPQALVPDVEKALAVETNAEVRSYLEQILEKATHH